MKIGTVLTATDTNPLYCGFVPLFVKAWKGLFPEVDVCIVLIADTLPIDLQEYSAHIRVVPPIPGMHTAFQAQCIRLLYPQTIERQEGVLITDMDMLPMNRYYYEQPIAEISPDTFVAYRDEMYPREIAMCYNVATPSVWASMFQGETLETMYKRQVYDGSHGGAGWNTDQLVLVKQFLQYSGKKTLLNDSVTRFRRLDRISREVYDPAVFERIRSGLFSDYHCLRPYSDHQAINEAFVNALLSK